MRDLLKTVNLTSQNAENFWDVSPKNTFAFHRGNFIMLLSFTNFLVFCPLVPDKMQPFAKFKKTMFRDFRTTLKFRRISSGSEPLDIMF